MTREQWMAVLACLFLVGSGWSFIMCVNASGRMDSGLLYLLLSVGSGVFGCFFGGVWALSASSRILSPVKRICVQILGWLLLTPLFASLVLVLSSL